MKIEPLFEAIANLAVFLETAPEEFLDPDEAVTQQEELALVLRKLDAETAKRLTAYFRRAAGPENDPARRKAFEELPQALGLTRDA